MRAWGAAFEPLRRSEAPRLRGYAEAIRRAARVCERLGLDEKPGDEATKSKLIQGCRNTLPERAVAWMDAALVLTRSRTEFPPLLGTGGNDGRLEFTNNFMQRLADVMSLEDGASRPGSRGLLRSALLGEVHDGLLDATMGQYDPGAGGGYNAGEGYDGKARVNPWDFILFLEGAILFASAAVRKLGGLSAGSMAAPFTARPTNAGHGSDVLGEKSRGELWMPLWESPTSLVELKVLFSEGRVTVGGRTARDGVDFARALGSLGVDRGLSQFQRFSLTERKGNNYLATPTGRYVVSRRPEVELLNHVDRWLGRFQDKTRRDKTPARVREAARRLDETILSAVRQPSPMRAAQLLMELGRCARALQGSLAWTRGSEVEPLPALSPEWLARANDGSVEFRLAAALASLSGRPSGGVLPVTRGHLSPVKVNQRGGRWRVTWADAVERDVAWSHGDPTGSMNAIIHRRLLKAEGRWLGGRVVAPLDDVMAFIDGQIDLRRFEALVWGAALIDWSRVGELPDEALVWVEGAGGYAASDYSLLKLCFTDHEIDGARVPRVRTIWRRAERGEPGVRRVGVARSEKVSCRPVATL